MSLRDKQRVIYTSPIKALSNQKYRELQEEFEDVGLMTGDVTINPSASCIVMTTEILRSMLYRGSEMMREVAWVIFDEIHYLRDKERGVVWEETIILLPDKVHYVFLSATIPNAKEFADWIAKLHSQPCNVVYTNYRPTPLQHYIFPAGGSGLHLVVDENGRFRDDNFQNALKSLVATNPSKQSKKKKNSGNGGSGGGASDCFKIVKMIMDRNYQPVIIFAFSKKECESLALQMSKLDFNTEDEKELVEGVFIKAIDSLSDDDKKLPQVESILPLLKRGIGIHHSGLLPILKEVIEILFQEGLVKALFATETFAMGLNMPAKTVVFTNVRKFDGKDFRWLSPGEYIQMSGRAGRRGLDDRGIVILMVDEEMEPHVAKNMLKGASDSLTSSFHLGYNMLLNLMRVEGVDPETLIKQSFHQFQSDKELPEYEKRLKELQSEYNSIEILDEEIVRDYYNVRIQLEKLRNLMRETINHPGNSLSFIQPGRLVRITDGNIKWGWGVIVNFHKKKTNNNNNNSSDTDNNTNEASNYIVDVLLNCDNSSNDKNNNNQQPIPAIPGSKGIIKVVPVLLSLFDGMSTIRVYVPQDLRTSESRNAVGKTLREVLRRYPDGLPFLDPVEDMLIEDPDFKKLIRRIESLEDKLLTRKEFKREDIIELCSEYEKKLEIESEIKEIKKNIRDVDQVIMKDELRGMKKTLRRLGFTNKENVVQTKGRVACEINASDELLLTEMMFNGVYSELTVPQILALLSCFVFQEKSTDNLELTEELEIPLRRIQDNARRVATIQKECKLNIDIDDYVQKFQPHMMELVYAWSEGAKFIEICKMTNIFEGSVIRCMRRLEELLRQLQSAAKAIGNTELEDKFAEAIVKIKRDIVFAVSLYL